MHDLIIVLAFIGTMVSPAVVMAKSELPNHSRRQTK
jgi:hypothetical protein